MNSLYSRQTEHLYSRFITLAPVYQSTDGGNGAYSEERANRQDNSVIRTMSVFAGDQTPVTIPVLSGNSIGGRIRRILANHLFDTCEIDVKEVYGNGTPDQKVTYHTLTSGGALIKTQHIEQLKLAPVLHKIPMLDLLGGVFGGNFFESNCAIFDAIPAAQQLSSMFPNELSSWFEDFDPTTAYTKHRDYRSFRSPDRSFVSLPDLPGYSTVVEEDETLEGETDGKKKEEGKKNPFRNMPTNHDYIVPQTPFVVRFSMYPTADEMQWSAIGLALRGLENHPFLGGRKKSGFGLVKWTMPDDSRLDPTLYEQYVRDNKDELRAILTHKKGFIAAILDGVTA